MSRGTAVRHDPPPSFTAPSPPGIATAPSAPSWRTAAHSLRGRAGSWCCRIAGRYWQCRRRDRCRVGCQPHRRRRNCGTAFAAFQAMPGKYRAFEAIQTDPPTSLARLEALEREHAQVGADAIPPEEWLSSTATLRSRAARTSRRMSPDNVLLETIHGAVRWQSDDVTGRATFGFPVGPSQDADEVAPISLARIDR
jgi:hypothetical protein